MPENALKKVEKETAVADATVADATVMNATVADTAGTAVTDAAVAVADATVVNTEPRLKEISHTRTKANELLLN
ncbi:hypothetical protein BDBG_18075 [Blastomyces gilchristii SLH14081]|uniref:Uncharacterized protein n=1 Tax=Blastomyces gilchristii (strain SLH14081) TaxID=559298 RepID=A0A179V532_BLAGS|nr:uncharacterized protein BDBG_18075 [Blastomyces gilchristii SLH14081]OAT14527.1 hypothetical protein BDBG_18075 [Blastomyces gilchristii SLH14081]